jgi:hypothetical protein
VLLARSKVEKRIKAIIPAVTDPSNEPDDAHGGGAF